MWMVVLPQNKMKALVYVGTQKMEYQEQPNPAKRAGEVQVNITAVGICGSDMHAYLGHDPRRVPPLILGHEASGVVTEGELSGKNVVINPLITCGQCDYCLDGRANLCGQRDLIGMYRSGAFAERISVPQRNLVLLPDGMDPVRAALTEPAATAVHAVNLADRASYRPLSDARALVLGAGSVGLFAALALAGQGVRHIALAETNALRRETADTTKICRVFDPNAAPPRETVYDVIIDAVGSSATRKMSMSAVRPGGVIIHIGLLDNEGGWDARIMTLQEVTVIGTYTYTPVDFRTTVARLHCGALGDLDWVEERPMARGAGAFSDLLQGRCAAAKIILRP
jgi:2-desacetyl-2-hydroxyethyl bacteriochlorophyllide A dehydrogenase